MSNVIKVIIVVAGLFLIGGLLFLLFPESNSGETEKWPETISVELSQEEIEEMHKMIEKFEKLDCEYLIDQDKNKWEEGLIEICFPKEVNSMLDYYDEGMERYEICQRKIGDFREPKRFKESPNRIMFFVTAITNYPELSNIEDDILFFFFKNREGKWRIEKTKGLIGPHDAHGMAKDIIQELKGKDAKGE